MQPSDLLTDLEHEVIGQAGRLWGLLCRIVGDGPIRDADLAELIVHIHVVQRTVMAPTGIGHARALSRVPPPTWDVPDRSGTDDLP